MDDRTLLELAAKAAGIVGAYDEPIPGICGIYEPFIGGADCPWNPLANDGQALRLAVKLGMGILYETQQAMGGRFIEVSYSQDEEEGTCKVATELLGDDPYAATRRAIVRAAAAMGSNIKPELDDADE